MPRKSKYFTHVKPRLDEVEAWLRDGLTNKEIAKKLRVSEDSLYTYAKQHPDFKELLRKTKEYVDQVEMVGAYKRRAMGYTIVTTCKKYRYRRKFDGTYEKILDNEEVKEVHVPGDPRAMENWLKHRMADAWGDVHTIEENEETGIIVLKEREIGVS